VRQDAFELVVVEHPHDAFGHRHGGVLGVAARREGIWSVTGDDVDPGHRQARARGQPPYHAEELGCRRLIHGLSAVHGEYNAVGEPVAGEIHAGGEHEGDQHTLLTTDSAADQDHETREGGEKNCGFEEVSHVALPPARMLAAGVSSVKQGRRSG
jgi:hypothetical protein